MAEMQMRAKKDENEHEKFKLITSLFTMEVSGRSLVIFVTAICLITFPSYVLYKHDQDMQQKLNLFANSIEKMNKHHEVLTYILTLTQEERTQLKLLKPQALREVERN